MAFTTHGHQIIGTTVLPHSPTMSVYRCGGPGICSSCSQEAMIVLNQIEKNPKPETRPEMLSEGGMIKRAKELVYLEFYADRVAIDPNHDIYVVWFSKTLQNWKALVSTNIQDDCYYEVTYNGDKNEAYVDAYRKISNIRVPD